MRLILLARPGLSFGFQSSTKVSGWPWFSSRNYKLYFFIIKVPSFFARNIRPWRDIFRFMGSSNTPKLIRRGLFIVKHFEFSKQTCNHKIVIEARRRFSENYRKSKLSHVNYWVWNNTTYSGFHDLMLTPFPCIRK